MNIKELRKKSGLSQQEMADKTGIPKDRIAAWEQGRGNPKVADYEILSKFFEIEGGEIILKIVVKYLVGIIYDTIFV